MRRLFGIGKEEAKAAPKAPPPSLQEASAKLDLSIQNLERNIAKCDEDIRAQVAKGATNPTAKARAMQILKRKKMYEEQKNQLLGTQFNVESIAFQQEQAEITATAVSAMQAGQKELAAQQKNMSVESVEQMIDDLQEVSDQAKEINDALAQAPMGMASGVDDDELEAEFARMQDEAAMEQLAGLGLTDTGGPAPVPAAGYTAPAKAAGAAPAAPSAEDLEYERLLASMSAGPTALPS